MDTLRNTFKHVSLKSKSSRHSGQVAPAPPTTATRENPYGSEPPLVGPPVRLAVIGAGQRGRRYGMYALMRPNHCTVTTVAEPRPETRQRMAEEHQVPLERVFSDWKELLAATDAHDSKRTDETASRYIDGVIVAVQDHMHAEVVIPFAQRGYHILCEKPMATTPEECIKMADEVDKAGIVFGMGHILRYSKYNQALREIIASGSLGKLVNVVHVEPVGHYHFAHSYVRGNWNQEAKSSFSLMTKSCHDMDLLCHFFAPATPVRFSSFGSLNHFRRSEKPVEAGTATRCLDCAAEPTCPYSAKRIYMTGNTGWPVSAIVDGAATPEKVLHEIEDGPYGVCVYESPNDVCDHQVVNVEFSNGSTASFTMVAFTKLICERQTRLHLTHGEVVGDSNFFTLTDFRTGKTERQRPSFLDAHGDGDIGVVRTFVHCVAVRLAKDKGEQVDAEDDMGMSVMEVLRSHLAVFCAERARRTGSVVSFEEFERQVRQGMSSSAGKATHRLVHYRRSSFSSLSCLSLVLYDHDYLMGDTCTVSPTFTSFSSSTSQTFSVSQSTSESVSAGAGTVVTRSVQSGTEWIVTESSADGATQTVDVPVQITFSAQEVIRVPVLTLYAPCSSTESTTSSTSTSSTSSTSSTRESTPAETSTTQRTSSTSRPANSQNTNAEPTPTPTSTQAENTSGSILTTITSIAPTTLSNGSQSSYVAVITSYAPNGSLNENNNSSHSGSGSTRAVAIGAGVAGGVIALIILIFGITWHMRRKRRNSFMDGDPLDGHVWGPDHESKALQSTVNLNPRGAGYSYNPYAEANPLAYAPVPTMSPPRGPVPLVNMDDRRLAAPTGGLGLGAVPQPKTADEILYEAARQDLPRSRTSSATATATSHRTHPSLAASNMTHSSLRSRRSESAVGLLEHASAPAPAATPQPQYQDLMDAPVDLSRPMSPVSVVAPRLAIANPDNDKDT
ncbi:Oxidoreductase [Ceratobasidium theobromae]|uniref:Oxidoreductase n=1 Tax=Ceratobasidium theobromae TaxID=1582974 RepID=A0A5N5QCY8_9AGAM|nr:Oxidoreductase [Ceratobasidium theobromae]